jgi:hypothetical protein
LPRGASIPFGRRRAAGYRLTHTLARSRDNVRRDVRSEP